MSTAVRQTRSALDGVSYEDLYKRWEDGHWSAHAIDFSRDRDGWAGLSEVQRSSARWLYSMFFYGEDSVTDNLSPYIDAAPTEEQKYFLATQQVDEARHAIFFRRFFADVIGVGGSIGDGLAATLPELGWGYRQVFGALDEMAETLRKDRSLPQYAQAIALYHLVVEATLAQPGQHFIEDFFADAGTMPGFSEGMRNVARDEQRHIGFGAKVLADAFAESDECKQAVAELLRDVLPAALAVFIPPGWDLRYTREYGFELEDIYAFAIGSVKSKWRSIGYPLEEMPAGTFPLDPDASEQDNAKTLLTLLRAGVVGAPNGRPDSAPEIQRLFFELMARAVDPTAIGEKPLTVQWQITDAQSWRLRIAGGAAHTAPGEEAHPDLTVNTDWATITGIAFGRIDPVRSVLTRKLHMHGSLPARLRMMHAMPRVRAMIPGSVLTRIL